MKSMLFLLPFLSSAVLAQTPGPPNIIKERNGNVTRHYAEGSLASLQDVGCIPLAKAKNTFTPPDLYKGVAECLAQDNYDFAVGLFMLAGIYAVFDEERITDKSVSEAREVLIMDTFSAVPEEKKVKFSEAISRTVNDPKLLGKMCAQVQKIGMPDYYPAYMILFGIKAFTKNPHEGALVRDFDSAGVWKKLQSEYLHCPPQNRAR